MEVVVIYLCTKILSDRYCKYYYKRLSGLYGGHHGGGYTDGYGGGLYGCYRAGHGGDSYGCHGGGYVGGSYECYGDGYGGSSYGCHGGGYSETSYGCYGECSYGCYSDGYGGNRLDSFVSCNIDYTQQYFSNDTIVNNIFYRLYSSIQGAIENFQSPDIEQEFEMYKYGINSPFNGNTSARDSTKVSSDMFIKSFTNFFNIYC